MRSIGNHPITRPAFVAAYQLVADVGSRVLADVSHADAVYLTGSLLSPQTVAPGVSDIDLFVVARLPTCAAELEFRTALRRRLHWLNAAAPVFYNLDYFDAGDAAFSLAFGNAWAQGFSGSFRVLRGNPLPRQGFERPPLEMAIERLVHLLWGWRKIGCPLLASPLDVESWVVRRAAERLLASAVEQGLGGAERVPFDQANEGDGGRRRHVRELLAETLEIMGRMADQCTAGWGGTWPATAAVSLAEPDAESWREARNLILNGFTSVYLVPSGPSARTYKTIAIGGEREAARSVVERAERSLGNLDRGSDPIRRRETPLILTRTLWRAGALFEPSPFTGAHIACGSCHVLGEHLPPPKAPPPEQLVGLLRARTTELFHWPRGRLLRMGKPSALARLESDLRLAPALSAALDTGELDLGRPHDGDFPGAESTEPIVLEALRRWISGRHEALRGELERRRR